MAAMHLALPRHSTRPVAQRPLVGAAVVLAGALWAAFLPAQDEEPVRSTTPRLKVAFIGDAGDPDAFDPARPSPNPAAVLRLIRDEGADLVLHQGDLGYNNPAGWIRTVNEILGEDFPYFFSIGNHDGGAWSEHYGPFLKRRVERLEEIHGTTICTGELEGSIAEGKGGTRLACNFQGLFFIVVDMLWSARTDDETTRRLRAGALNFLAEHVQQNDAIWRVCSWHPSELATAGFVPLFIGAEPYEICRQAGAIVANGHSHSYSRTRTLNDLASPRVDPEWPGTDRLHVDDGSTFLFVSGLGGTGVHRQSRCFEGDASPACAIWASSYSETYGALFIEFHVDDDPRAARGYFKNIDGEIVDEFTVTSGRARRTFVRGDADSNERINLSDAVDVLEFLFVDRRDEVACRDAADRDDSGTIELSDAVGILLWLFRNGEPPAPPTPSLAVYESTDCDADPTVDDLGCAVPSGKCD